MALGEHKAAIVKELCEGTVMPRVPASYLLDHDDATVLVDSAAGKDLNCRATPWVTGSVEWSPAAIKRAVAPGRNGTSTSGNPV